MLEVDTNARAQRFTNKPLQVRHLRLRSNVTSEPEPNVPELLLNHLKATNAREVLHQVREELAGQNSTIGCLQRIKPATHDLLQKRQTSTTPTGSESCNGAISVGVSHERHPV